ncbi:MAG: serine/threonine-protein kinase [Acidobacteriota bacterium]
MPASRELLIPGSRLREYEIIEPIARGGMGAVYRARHVYLEQERAIKIILPNVSEMAGMVDRFIREARILVRLRHPNLVQLFEFGTLEDGAFFMILELIRGESVLQRLQRIQRVPVSDAIRIVREAGQGLAAAHSQGIVHRDIAPDNLLLVQSEQGKEITKVIDFGIAKPIVEDTQHTLSSGLYVGKPQYSSPEQCGIMEPAVAIDHRTDIYSLGVTLYYMVTGRLPFDAPTPIAYLFKHVQETPQPPSTHMAAGELPQELDALIMRALSKRREDRHASMEEFLNELGRVPCEGREEPERAVAGPEVLVHELMVERRYSQAVKILSGLIETDPGNPRWKKLRDRALNERALREIRRAKKLLREKQLDRARTVLVRLDIGQIPSEKVASQAKQLWETLEREMAPAPPEEATAPIPAQAAAPDAAEREGRRRLLEAAAQLHQEGRDDEAIANIMSVMYDDPENERARELEIIVRVSMEEREMAGSVAERARAIADLATSDRMHEARDRIKELQSFTADTSFEEASERLSADTLQLIAAIESGSYEPASQTLRGMAARHPLLAPVKEALQEYAGRLETRHRRWIFDQYVAAGRQAMGESRWANAIEYFDFALQLDVDDEPARQKAAEERASAEAAAARERRLRSLLYQIDSALRAESWDQALEVCNQVLGGEFALVIREEEIEWVRKAIERANLPRIEKELSAAEELWSAGDLVGARDRYSRILEAFPQQVAASQGLRELEDLLRRFNSAVDRASQLFERDQREEALRLWLEALNMCPQEHRVREKIVEVETLIEREQAARRLFRQCSDECRAFLASNQLDAARQALDRSEACIRPGLRLDDLRIELVALQSDLERRVEKENLRQKLLGDFLASARRLYEAGELESALGKTQDLLRAAPGNEDASRLRQAIETQLTKERVARQVFAKQSRRCRQSLVAGDLEDARVALRECQACLQPELRLEDLRIELAVLYSEVEEAADATGPR